MKEENICEPQEQKIDYFDGDTTFEGYVVVPDTNAASRACVVLTHDWSGLTAPTKRLATRYAALGTVARCLYQVNVSREALRL
ncbi:hypothetical protein [Pararhizobium sp. IMCC21322]|uniref:hypothetical protein n=1 Tax=Pararhizobium sp. IMCC21322 TaxID=3067903 RepID=UPI0027418154|nr:hypothetical protein [Pararhizobium sp. IMCC21322]